MAKKSGTGKSTRARPSVQAPRAPGNKPAPRVLLVGASGTLGRTVHAELAQRHEVIAASRSSAQRVDITDRASVIALLEQVGQLDAIVERRGHGAFWPARNDDR
ncbi:MAG: NAD-dependent epimerase/dehydratase family protein [Rudaea sp.]